MDQVKIGGFIAALRKEKDMTQKALADKLGISDRAVSKWENGRGLPNVAFMKQLCQILDITVDELLSGERSNKTETELTHTRNLINVLHSRELEIKKRRMMQKLCAVFITLVIIIGSIITFSLFTYAISSASGEGYSFSTAVYTAKAERTAKLIEYKKYEKAVKHIGFSEQNNEYVKKLWIESMETLDIVINIEHFEVSKIILDDYFPKGTYYITVYDSESDARYVFDGQVSMQNGGIVFGSIYISNENTDYRRTEVAKLIQTALCTWNPG